MGAASRPCKVNFDWTEALINWNQEIHHLYPLVLFALITALIFQSWGIAWLVMAGLGVHELGHVFMDWIYGIDWEIGFGPAGAWTRTPLKKRQQMGHFANSMIHLAGPMFNLIYAIAAVGVHTLLGSNSVNDYWLKLANFSALLGLLNLLPMGRKSDGGKFIQRLFASLEEKVERRLVWVLLIWVLGLIWLIPIINISLTKLGAIVLIGVWFVGQMLMESERDTASQAGSSQTMSNWQAAGLIILMLFSLLVFTAIVLATPFWLSRSDILHMASGWTSTLLYLGDESPLILRALLLIAVLLLAYMIGRKVIRHLR
jgi:hypothetical protein